MFKRQMICAALAILSLLLLGAQVLAETGSAELKCVPEQPDESYLGRDDVSSKGIYDIPRKQVLLEIATATW